MRSKSEALKGKEAPTCIGQVGLCLIAELQQRSQQGDGQRQQQEFAQHDPPSALSARALSQEAKRSQEARPLRARLSRETLSAPQGSARQSVHSKRPTRCTPSRHLRHLSHLRKHAKHRLAGLDDVGDGANLQLEGDLTRRRAMREAKH